MYGDGFDPKKLFLGKNGIFTYCYLPPTYQNCTIFQVYLWLRWKGYGPNIKASVGASFRHIFYLKSSSKPASRSLHGGLPLGHFDAVFAHSKIGGSTGSPTEEPGSLGRALARPRAEHPKRPLPAGSELAKPPAAAASPSSSTPAPFRAARHRSRP